MSSSLLQRCVIAEGHTSCKAGDMSLCFCRAYTFGHNWFVEVDVVLPEEMSLRTAHDIGESLQIKLERLPDVARAFVHLDYETSHRPEHKDV